MGSKWGGVRVTGSSTRLSDQAAQEIYRAPEARIAPRPEAIKLDLFALGAIAYFVLTGEPPAVNGDELVARC